MFAFLKYRFEISVGPFMNVIKLTIHPATKYRQITHLLNPLSLKDKEAHRTIKKGSYAPPSRFAGSLGKRKKKFTGYKEGALNNTG